MSNSKIKDLGEVVLRIKDIETSKYFYEEVVGLELIKKFDGIMFFKVADGVDGHPQVVGLFLDTMPVAFPNESRAPSSIVNSSLHHFALLTEHF